MTIAKQFRSDKGRERNRRVLTVKLSGVEDWFSREDSHCLQEVEAFGLGSTGRLRRLNATPNASSHDVMMVVNAITMIPFANCA